jgi:hypothetical protein
VIIATASSAAANSYVSIEEASLLLGDRLYTDAWDGLSGVPSALGWTLAGPASAAATTVNISGGFGVFTVGTVIQFAGDTTYYSITDITDPANPIFAPGLSGSLSAGVAVSRVTNSAKEKALIQATNTLDSAIIWDGTIASTTQPLRWPRHSVTDCDGVQLCSDCFPTVLKRVTTETALALATRDLSGTPGVLGLGISRAKVAEIEVEMDASMVVSQLPSAIRDMVACIGTPRRTQGDRTVRTVPT